MLSDIKARLEYERAARADAERDIREANGRYKQADANARALEKLADLYATFAAGGEYDGTGI